MSSLVTRIISALCAVGLLLGVYSWRGNYGVILFCVVLAVIAVYEFNRLVFKPQGSPMALRVWFFTCCSSLLLLTIWYKDENLMGFWAIITSGFYATSLWMAQKKINNEAIVGFFSASALGFVYCALLPSVTIRILLLDSGLSWLFTLLLVVFAGDVFAYFGGHLFGKKKLMPAVSPGKTVAGSYSGFVGSAVAGGICGTVAFPQHPLWVFIASALVAGFFAQSGDLFISLLKRVAQVKDSGKIMPGHGGVLDRLDGVFFASPVIFATAIWLLPAS